MMNVIVPLLGGFIITAAFMPSLIRYFRARHEGQMIREEGPTWHEKKSGTPTMGGLLFIVAILVMTLASSWLLAPHHTLSTTWTLLSITLTT